MASNIGRDALFSNTGMSIRFKSPEAEPQRCRFQLEMHQKTFDGRAPHGTARGTYVLSSDFLTAVGVAATRPEKE